jgi:hypothetical protein
MDVIYESNKTAKDLIDEVIDEADIALDIPTTTYLRWLNELEQNIYGGVVKGTRKEMTTGMDGKISIGGAVEDITAIYAGTDALAKVSAELLPLMRNSNFYAICDGEVLTDYGDGEFTVYYIDRPALKTSSNYSTETVRIPTEFLELVYSKLRGEAYKLANEDGLAAKWLADYNARLADFAAWHEQRKGYGE